MLLTRATDNRLKAFFSGGEVRHGSGSFQGRGSLARPGGDLRLGDPSEARSAFRREDGTWCGDVVAPLIRDAGVAIAMLPTAATIRMILNGQMGSWARR